MTKISEQDLRDRLQALREHEPTTIDVTRAVAAATAPAPSPARPASRRRLAAAGCAVAAGVGAVAVALPAGSEEEGGALGALRAAAAAAADDPGPAAFTGFRHVVLRDRRDQPWGVPDDACVRRMEAERRRQMAAARRGEQPDPATPQHCGMKARARYSEEGRVELWVDARNEGVRRDHGSRVLEASGDGDLVEAIHRDFGRKPATGRYEYGDGAFARVPLADLPTEPRALLDVLRAAHRDGRWAGEGRGPVRFVSEAGERRDLALMTILLITQANATPELRAAAFRALALLPGVVDLGEERDPEGREGHGIAVRHGADPRAALGAGEIRLVFDEGTGDVLSWSESFESRIGPGITEWVVLRAGHVEEVPAAVRAAVRGRDG